MQINISARHGSLSSDTREKISAKVQKLSRLYERLTVVDVTIDLEHAETPAVELRVSVERADDFVATARSDSLIGSIDSSIHKLEQQLRKYKEKIKGHRLPGLKNQEVPAEPDAE